MECVCWWNCHYIINNVCSALHLPWIRRKNQDTSRSMKMRSWSFCCSFPPSRSRSVVSDNPKTRRNDRKKFSFPRVRIVWAQLSELWFSCLKTIMITVSKTFLMCSHNKFLQMSVVSVPFEDSEALSLFLPHLSLEIWDKAACFPYRALAENALYAGSF